MQRPCLPRVRARRRHADRGGPAAPLTGATRRRALGTRSLGSRAYPSRHSAPRRAAAFLPLAHGPHRCAQRTSLADTLLPPLDAAHRHSKIYEARCRRSASLQVTRRLVVQLMNLMYLVHLVHPRLLGSSSRHSLRSQACLRPSRTRCSRLHGQTAS